jgi:sulfite exporter TauE/SafE
MCGPLAIAFCNRPNATNSQILFNALSYNIGRTLTYTLLGIIFGSIGSFLFLVDLQKYLSVIIGAVLIISVLFSLDLESRFNKISFLSKINFYIKNKISKLVRLSQTKSPLSLGMFNGLLPCGLVYLAIAGALSSQTMMSGALFMMMFGLGTIPALFLLVIGSQSVSPKLRSRFRQVLPFVNILFGIFLIYRGVVVDMPESLNFWEAIKNPVLCH